MNIGPDANPMDAFSELMHSLLGVQPGQGGGQAPVSGGSPPITSRPLPPIGGDDDGDGDTGDTPGTPDVDSGYNPLHDDALINERAWLAQHQNAPEAPSMGRAPMGKAPVQLGVQAGPGPSTPPPMPPMAAAPPPKPPMLGGQSASVGAPRDPTHIFSNAGNDISSVFAPIIAALTPKPSAMDARLGTTSPAMTGGGAPNLGIRDKLLALLASRGGAAPVTQRPRSVDPQMPTEMINAMLADKNKYGDTSGNTPIR